MFKFKIHQEVSCIAEGSGVFYARTGAMVAFQGNFTAEKVLLDTNKNTSLLRAFGNLAMRKLTGENVGIMKVSGTGKYFMANDAKHIIVLTLSKNQSVMVESEDLLAYTEDCKYSVKFMGQGIVSQKGLFTSQLTALEEGEQVIITSNGNPIVLETPCTVDPDAVICWTGADPNFNFDVSWKTFIGQGSGESYTFEFRSQGETVIVQPSERVGGVSNKNSHTSGINFNID